MITIKDISGISKGHVLDSDGHKIGSVGQIFVDNTTGEPAWATVHTGLFGTKHSFVPLSEATVSGEDVRVPFDKAKIKDAPRVEADGELSAAEEEELYRHYGVQGGTRGHDDRGHDERGHDERGHDERGHDERGHDDGGHDERGHDDRPVESDLNSHGMVEAQAAAAAAEVGGRTGGRAEHERSGHDAGAETSPREEQPNQGTRTGQAGPTRIRRYVITEQQTITVPVTHEKFVVEPDPDAADARIGEGDDTTGRHGQR